MPATTSPSGMKLKGRRRVDGGLPGISFEPCARLPRISICSYFFVWRGITGLDVTTLELFRSSKKCSAADLSVGMSLNS